MAAVLHEIRTKHKDTICGQNVRFLSSNLVVHNITTGLQKVNKCNRDYICSLSQIQCSTFPELLYYVRKIQHQIFAQRSLAVI